MIKGQRVKYNEKLVQVCVPENRARVRAHRGVILGIDATSAIVRWENGDVVSEMLQYIQSAEDVGSLWDTAKAER